MNGPEPQPRRPPRWANVLVRTILQSPFHWVISKQLMLITFRGRTSGKTFTTPVGYMRTPEGYVFFTDHPWWKNLVR